MAKSECSICVYENATGTKVEPSSLSNAAWGRRIGVSESSVRRHYKHLQTPAEGPSDPFLTEHDIPAGAVTSRGMSVRDANTGSWQKVSWNPNAKALADTLKYDDLREALDGWGYEATRFEPAAPFTSVLMASDIQAGKASEALGGTPEMIQRVRKSFHSFAKYLQDARPERAILFDGGDPIENVWNTPSQLVTNDLSVPEQIRVFRRLMLEGIKLIAPLVPELVYGSVPSNHGAARTGYKSPGGTVDADFGLEISYQLEDAVRENPYLSHVSFARPEPLSETCVIESSGTRVAFNHGHQSGGLFGHGKWWANQDHGRKPGWDADILVVSHYHTPAYYLSGDGRSVICCSSSDGGSGWYTNRSGESARSGMTAFDVSDKFWSSLRIL